MQPSAVDLGFRFDLLWPQQVRCFDVPTTTTSGSGGSTSSGLPYTVVYISEFLGKHYTIYSTQYIYSYSRYHTNTLSLYIYIFIFSAAVVLRARVEAAGWPRCLHWTPSDGVRTIISLLFLLWLLLYAAVI